jgi:uncharacterized protein DUF4326
VTCPKRVVWNRYSGEPLPTNAKLVDRSGRYGNPFTLAKYGREQALELHRGWLRGDPEAVAQACTDGWRWPGLNGHRLINVIRINLAGRDLVCTGCSSDERCHADELLRIAAGGEP